MITISVCMIVKNESQILRRCLDSLHGIYDELIIVDTGSTDNTIEIAHEYTDKVFEFEWTGSFSDARNFAIEKAACEYIYSADADEIIEGENRQMFMALKECLDTDVDVVQMYYGNQLDQGTVYNFDKELRPKLFKRVKHIHFEEPIHETINIEPIIIDTDIVITHKPVSAHTSRDLDAFFRIIDKGERLSERLQKFFARELYLSGDDEALAKAAPYLTEVTCDCERSDNEIIEACTLLVRYFRLKGDYLKMFDCVVKVVAAESNSEVCSELGHYYYEQGNLDDAAIWYYNAYHECTPVMSIRAGHEIPLTGLANVYAALGETELENNYRDMAMHPANE